VFVVTIDADDDRFSATETASLLTNLGVGNVHLVHATAN
jgi:hypothetical protein